MRRGMKMARVIVVNNSDEFLGMMTDLLAAAGHECIALKGEEQTVDHLAAAQPDAMIVDLRLSPSLLTDGWALVLGARSHPDLEDVPIIVATADHDYLRERADEISAMADVHALPKPFSITDVEALLEQLFGRTDDLQERATTGAERRAAPSTARRARRQ